MELKIIEEKQNPLFNRKEISAEISADVTPNKQEVKKLIAEKLKTHPETIIIKNILGKFGSKEFTINAHIYNSVEDKEKIEPNKKKDKKSKAGGSS